MNRSTFWACIILLALLSMSTIFLLFMFKKTAQNHHTATAKDPFNAYMIDSTIYKFNAKGKLVRRINATQMQHYATDNKIIFTNPNILMHTTNQTRWDITAARGKSLNNNRVVKLYGHVKLHQPQQANHPETTVMTSELTIYPKQSKAHTNKPTTIVRPNSIIKGTGVDADLQKGIYNLLSHSRGIYVAQQAQQKQSQNKHQMH